MVVRTTVIVLLLVFAGALVAAGRLAPAAAVAQNKGKELFELTCTACHSIDLVTPLHNTNEQWNGLVQSMIDKGAYLKKEDVPVLVGYLALNFGVKPETPAQTLAAGQRGAAPGGNTVPANPQRGTTPAGPAAATNAADLQERNGGEPGSVTGIVVRDGTMKGLGKARVELFPIESKELDGLPFESGSKAQQEPRATAAYRGTDADRDGRFKLTGVRPGRYTLIAEREGFVHPATETRGVKPFGDVVVVNAAKNIDVVIRMRPAPAIAGTVTSPINAPLPAALVEAYRVRSTSSGQQLDLARTAITGDRGDYRLVWLSPGDYYVVASYPHASAAGPPGALPNPNIAVHDDGFRPVYFPESPNAAGARIVRVEASDVEGINIALKDAATASVKGRADSSTAPSTPRTTSLSGVVARADTPIEERLPGARVELFAGPGTPLITRTDGGGNFAFSNLAPGAYRLRVTRDGYLRQEYGAEAPDAAGETIILAAGQQKNDVRLPLQPASTLSGFVVDENGEPSPNVIVQALRPRYDALGNRIIEPAFFTFTDDRGHYRLYWVDPGDYHIAAVASAQLLELTGTPAKPADTNAYLNAAFLSRFEDQGVPVAVASGANVTATVRVIPSQSK